MARRAPFSRPRRGWWRLRGGEPRLSELDDRLLRDVGLDRGGVETPERPDGAVVRALELWLLGRVP